ncbi:penicillin-binding transpeptidase domain-containing protein [Alicyclobacillus ferrooxydans]|uniref:Peptidoglycan glycosyltransferase n=1 Tax=Alicyclobacillus ferrooxydans TaxID=471514 RepID=A0A0P9CDE8_9BACL|nr:penicillin-binding transpeptidase domain-containing protein [Alicyclobacillus ferrooxydans]KPV40868.1 peptidoglycan glycosyltransferase [Alicyclobacillus ferrooxydans]
MKTYRLSRNRKRILGIHIGLTAMLGMVVFRIGYIQMAYGQRLLNQQSQVVDVSRPLIAARGAILDSSGSKLAYDVPAYYVDIKTVNFRNYAAAASKILAPILSTSSTTLQSLLQSNNKWIQLSFTIMEPQKVRLQNAFNQHQWDPKNKSIQWSTDVTFTPTEQRYYPYGTFAANTLGYVSTSGTSVGGIEQEYNQLLAGTSGVVTYKKDGYGFPLPNTEKVTKAAHAGDNIQLTLNGSIQGFVQNEMNSLVNQFHPDHAAIIVANPQTGAILAMSSSPTFNPNSYWTATAKSFENWAVSSTFEPGSTFKPVVLAAALATNSIALNQTFQSGQITIAGATIHDWNYFGWGKLTFQQALEKSSNVGFATIAGRLGWPNLSHYMQVFGFDRPTGINLPNEASSILFPSSQRGPVQLATSGFGQGISVTPLQQIQAIGAIANGGKLMRPYIVSKITSPTGKVIKQYGPTIENPRVVPPAVAHAVSHVMVLDVSGKSGIDTTAQIPGYLVAGKTGTAQVPGPNGQFYTNRFITSFIGFVPANNPKVEVYVTVDWPKVALSKTWGSTVAAPFATAIMKYCLQYYHIPPNTVTASSSTSLPQGHAQYVVVPDIVGSTPQRALTTLQQLGLNPSIIGVSGNVTEQWPLPGTTVEKGSRMIGLMSTVDIGKSVTMPNLVGLSMRDADSVLSALSLTASLHGAGYVVQQSVRAGSKVTIGTTISITGAP